MSPEAEIRASLDSNHRFIGEWFGVEVECVDDQAFSDEPMIIGPPFMGKGMQFSRPVEAATYLQRAVAVLRALDEDIRPYRHRVLVAEF